MHALTGFDHQRYNPGMSQRDPNSRTLIVGGGLAGLAAAAELSKRHIPVTLVEARPRLGGRATSFNDQQTGDLVDNCQHVGMGCCTNLQAFCDDFGLSDHFQIESELTFFDRSGVPSRFSATSLPAPFHLANALQSLSYLSGIEKRELTFGLRRLAAERRFDGPFLHWLYSACQGERVRRLFWHVVLVSALSDTLERVSTQAARKVFVDGFFRNRNAWEVHLPTKPLDDLYGSPVIETLTARGVDVRLNSAIDQISTSGEGQFKTTLRNGEEIVSEACVLAVPHHRVASLVPNELADSAAVIGARSLEPAPIASVHLWFDRSITALPHAVFVEHLSQWMFCRPSNDAGRHYFQVVISASHELESRTRQSIIDEVCNDLATAFPVVGEANLEHARVVVEKRAVFSPTPASQLIRPAQRSELSGFYFAGDWTDTGWPATMEGAVRSGYLAAEAVLQDRGQPVALVADDLPKAFLSRLFGLT